MVYSASIVIFAAVVSVFVTTKIGAPVAFFVMLALYLTIVFWVALELVPQARRRAVKAYRAMQERRSSERRLYRALWSQR